MREISCIDETFDNNYTIEYKLSIQVSLDGFSFCILDNLRNKFLLFKHIPYLLSNNQFLFQKVSEILKTEEYLQGKFKSVTISYASRESSIIPAEVNTDDTSVLSGIYHITESEGIKSIPTKLPNKNLVFAYPKAVFDLLEQKFPENKTTHSAIANINQGIQKAKKKYPHGVISVHKNNFSIYLFEEEKLVFSNAYLYTNEIDFIYFALESVKSAGFKTTLMPIYINGFLEEKSAIYNLLVKYFFDVIF